MRRVVATVVVFLIFVLSATRILAQDPPDLPVPESGSWGGGIDGENWTIAWTPEQYSLTPYGISGSMLPLMWFWWPPHDATGNVQWLPDVDPFAGAYQTLPAYAAQAVAIFRGLFGVGPSPSDPLVVGIVKDLHNESLNEEGFAQRPFLGLFAPGRGASGIIYFPAKEVGSNCEPVIMAHETAHYVMYKFNDSNWNDVPDWLIEGGAEYLASLVFDEDDYSTCFRGRYWHFGMHPDHPLWTEREYDAYPFLRWLHGEGINVVDLLKDALNGYPPQALISRHQLDEKWSEYVAELWGDDRYAVENQAFDCDKSYPPMHEHYGAPDSPMFLNPEEEGPVFNWMFQPMEPYTASYYHFRSNHSDLYRVYVEEVTKRSVNDDIKIWASVYTGTGSSYEGTGQDQVELTERKFTQFVPGEGTETDTTHYHNGNDVALAVSCVKDPDEGSCDFGNEIDASRFAVSISLPDVWQLKQLRLGSEEPYERVPVIGLMTLMVYKLDEVDGSVRLVNKTRHLWPNFSASYYQKAVERGPETTRVMFRRGGTMEKFVETSCWFWGKQIMTIQDVDSERWIEDMDKWDQRLNYTFKAAGQPVLASSAHRFRCVPNAFTNETLAPMMLGGMAGAASASAVMARWTRLANDQGFGEDSWAAQLEDIFMGALTYGLTGDEEKELVTSYVRKTDDNYFLVKVNEALVLTYREVKR